VDLSHRRRADRRSVLPEALTRLTPPGLFTAEDRAVTLAQRARVLMAQFGALPLEVDGSTRVPPALRRAIVDLALDVLLGPDSSAKAGAW